jgi:hypothetical protein
MLWPEVGSWTAAPVKCIACVSHDSGGEAPQPLLNSSENVNLIGSSSASMV